MDTSTNPSRALHLSQIALSVLTAGIFVNAGCTRDASDVGAVQFERTGTLLQDENLVPEYPDVSNPGDLEPLGSLWPQLDEDIPNDDVDYVWRNRWGLPPVYAQATVNLTDPVGAPSPSQNHILIVRWKVTGNYSTSSPQPTLLFYELLQGSNRIASKTVFPSGQSYVTDSVGVNGSSITNYAALRIRFSIQLKPASASDEITGRITWARLEIR